MLGDIAVIPESVGSGETHGSTQIGSLFPISLVGCGGYTLEVGEATPEGMVLELCTDVRDGCGITGMVRAREKSENNPTKMAVCNTA